MRERELKIVIDDPLAGVESLAGGVLGPAQARHIEDVYHDATDLRLARAGVTLRWREGTGWTVKLPVARTKRSLDRHELVVDGDAGWIPDAARALVLGHLRDAELVPVATFSTHRTARPLLLEGEAVAEVTDDDVRADTFDGRRVRFREIEIELADGVDEGLLARIAATLPPVLAAIDAPPMPKLVRALGSRAQEPADVDVPTVDDDATVSEVIAASMATSVRRFLDVLPLLRIDDGDRPVHDLRAATRRLRADLRVFGPVLDAAWVTGLRTELDWVATELGRVRDLDVIEELLTDAFERHVDLAPGLASAATATISARRAEARGALLVHLVDGRAVELYERLVVAAAAPLVIEGADERADRILPPLVRRTWKELRAAVARFDDLLEAADATELQRSEALHDVRLWAKRVRYSTNSVRPALTDSARAGTAKRFARSAAEIQTEVGDLHDAFVTAEWLQAAIVGWDVEAVFAAGRLVERLRHEAVQEIDPWRRAFEAMGADRNWMKRRG